MKRLSEKSLPASFAGILLIWLLTLLAGNPLSAQDEFPEATSWVNDFTGTLTPTQRQTLDARLRALETKTSTQIFVAVFNRVPANYVMEDYVTRLFTKWGPGRKKEQNGVLLAIFLRDRKLRIEVGYGLEDALTDLHAAVIIRDEIAPPFQRGEIYTGISRGVNAIIASVEGRYNLPVRRRNTQSDDDNTIFWLLLTLFILRAIWLSRRSRSTTYTRKGHRSHRWDGPIIFTDFGRSSGGSRSSGGGFGGFGGGFGGMSGGGGASGGW